MTAMYKTVRELGREMVKGSSNSENFKCKAVACHLRLATCQFPLASWQLPPAACRLPLAIDSIRDFMVVIFGNGNLYGLPSIHDILRPGSHFFFVDFASLSFDCAQQQTLIYVRIVYAIHACKVSYFLYPCRGYYQFSDTMCNEFRNHHQFHRVFTNSVSAELSHYAYQGCKLNQFGTGNPLFMNPEQQLKPDWLKNS